MKKIIALILICSFALAIEGNPLWDEMASACEETSSGKRCLELSFQFNVPVKFEENIYCYSNTTTTNPELINVCYSTVSLTKIETFELVYVIEGEEWLIEYSHENKTFFIQNYSVALTPNAVKSVDLAKCSVSYSNESEMYIYECPYAGKKKTVDLTVLVEDSFAIVAFSEPEFGLEVIIYIVIATIILTLLYMSLKKKKK